MDTMHLVKIFLIVTVMVTIGAPMSAEAQSVDSWSAPRTPDGQPDIQGIWTNVTSTPLERPQELEDKAFFSEEEVTELERNASDRWEVAIAPGRTEIKRLPEGRRFAGYNGAIWANSRSIVKSRRTSLVVDPPNGLVPLRPEAAARRDYLIANRTDTYENMSTYTRCITRGIPGSMLPNTYNIGNHILQTPGYVVIVYEMIGETRIIPLDDRPHIQSGIDLWMGDSRGHWDGETLVVETTNFTEKGWIAPNQNAGQVHGVPVSRNLRVVERFTRLSEDVLDWQATIEDPEVYTQPWTIELPLLRDPAYDLYEYACHEGNYAIANILRGARVRE